MSAAAPTSKVMVTTIPLCLPNATELQEKWKALYKTTPISVSALIILQGIQKKTFDHPEGCHKALDVMRASIKTINHQTTDEEFIRIKTVVTSCLMPKQKRYFLNIFSVNPSDTYIIETPSELDLLKALDERKPKESKLEAFSVMYLSTLLSSVISGNSDLEKVLRDAVFSIQYLKENDKKFEMEWIWRTLIQFQANTNCYPSEETILKFVEITSKQAEFHSIHLQILKSIVKQVSKKPFLPANELIKFNQLKFYNSHADRVLRWLEELAEDLITANEEIEKNKKAIHNLH
jgi:hypothetical protein